MSSSICRSLTRFTKHNILFTTALPWTAGPCFSWRLRRGQWLASLLPPPPHPNPPPLFGGVMQSRQEGVGEFLHPLALSLFLHQRAVSLPLLSDVLCGPFSHGCFPVSSELCDQPCPPVFPYPGNLSLLPQLLGSLCPLRKPCWTAPKMDGWGHTCFSPRMRSWFFLGQANSGSPGCHKAPA